LSVPSLLALFLGSVALTIISSIVLGRDIDRIARRLRLSEGFAGLLTALGADAPEISTAIIALLQHQHDLGVGVVIGSCVFNLAGLLGLSALVAGRVRVGRQGLALDSLVAVSVIVVALAMVLRILSPGASVALASAAMAPYVLVLALRPGTVAHLPLPGAMHRFLDLAVVHAQQDARHDQTPPRAGWTEFLSVIPALASVVFGSFGMVNSAVPLGSRWGLPPAITGTLVLAGLTSLPNVVMAVRLALHGRGAAVVSETLNSNTLNLLAGLCLPALIFNSTTAPSSMEALSTVWLLGMTVVAVVFAFFRGRVSRLEGLALIVFYIAFAAIVARFS
jgi:cation:H+ antiporter